MDKKRIGVEKIMSKLLNEIKNMIRQELNEDYSQRARNFRVALRRRLETMKKGEKISYGKLFYIAKGNNNFKDNRGRTVPGQDIVQTFKFAVQNDIMQHRGAAGDDMVDAYLTFESKLNENAILAFSNELNDEGIVAGIFDAIGDGKTVDAQFTKRKWDDGVPVTKFLTRGGTKSIKTPKGKFQIIETPDFWYYEINNGWAAIKRNDYGTPPFEY